MFGYFRRKIALAICPELRPLEPQKAQAAETLVTGGHLITLGELYAAHRGLTLSTVSTYAASDGKFLPKLKRGSGCTLRKAEHVLNWFSSNWPDDLAWPADIPRPSKKPRVA